MQDLEQATLGYGVHRVPSAKPPLRLACWNSERSPRLSFSQSGKFSEAIAWLQSTYQLFLYPIPTLRYHELLACDVLIIDSMHDKPLSAEEQQQLRAFVSRGGTLIAQVCTRDWSHKGKHHHHHHRKSVWATGNSILSVFGCTGSPATTALVNAAPAKINVHPNLPGIIGPYGTVDTLTSHARSYFTFNVLAHNSTPTVAANPLRVLLGTLTNAHMAIIPSGVYGRGMVLLTVNFRWLKSNNGVSGDSKHAHAVARGHAHQFRRKYAGSWNICPGNQVLFKNLIHHAIEKVTPMSAAALQFPPLPPSVGAQELSAPDIAALPLPFTDRNLSPNHPVTIRSSNKPGTLLGLHVVRASPTAPHTSTGKLVVLTQGTVVAYDATDISFPDGTPLRQPAGNAKKVWRAPQLETLIRDLCASKHIGGLGGDAGPTVATVLNAWLQAGIGVYIIGGTVRELLHRGMAADIQDVDIAFTCPAQQLLAVCAKHGWPHVGPTIVGVVRVGSGIGAGTVQLEGRAVGSYNMSINEEVGLVQAIGADLTADCEYRDFACNTVYFCWRSGVLIDPTGWGVYDSVARVVRIAASRWSHWAAGNAANLVRYWKFVAQGYQPASEDTRFEILAQAARHCPLYGAQLCRAIALACVTKMRRDVWAKDKWRAFWTAVEKDMGAQFAMETFGEKELKI